MTTYPSSARNRRRKRQAVQREAMLLAARAGGCICEPDVIRKGPDHYGFAHDDWCPMISRGDRTQFIFHNPDGLDRGIFGD